MEITGCPSLSLGVVHEGEIIMQYSRGVADTSTGRPVNHDTVYMIGSLTKAFIAASCGILVDEGKLSWTEPLSTYIPFTQNKDPVIGERMSLSDALSHSSGFPQLDIAWYGSFGETLMFPQHLLQVTANMPVHDDAFRKEFHYSNWPYALAGRVIEAVGGEDAVDGWGGFVKKRIFDPLWMIRSTCSRSDIQRGNLAEPHMVLGNEHQNKTGPWRLPAPQVSDRSICGAAMAIWSNIVDMLIWSRAVLERLEEEKAGKTSAILLNPLKHISQITSHKFPVTDDTINENTYGFGWARHMIPSTQLGWLSTNGPQKDDIIGRESPPRLTLYHGGQVTGYLNSIYLFPETKSAVVVLTNAQSAGDCSDLVAQMLVQSLFDMKPEVDFEMRAKKASVSSLSLHDKMREDWHRNRKPRTGQPELRDFKGSYCNHDICGLIQVHTNRETHQLEMRRNGNDTQRRHLQHYHNDTFSFFSEDANQILLGCMVDYSSYEQFLLVFIRNEEGTVIGFDWVMQEGFKPLRYIRQRTAPVSGPPCITLIPC